MWNLLEKDRKHSIQSTTALHCGIWLTVVGSVFQIDSQWIEDAFKVDPDCFGERFVHKLNEYEYMWYGDPFGSFYENIIPELSMTFQFYHMIF